MELRTLIISFICIFFIFMEHEVDAKKRDVTPSQINYGSMERRSKHLQIKNINRGEREIFENDNAEFPMFIRRRKRKKQQTFNNNNELLSSNSRKKEERKKRNKKRRKKAKYNKRFIKTTLKDIDRDSNMSDSKDSDKKNKPVDIIVHIKMND